MKDEVHLMDKDKQILLLQNKLNGLVANYIHLKLNLDHIKLDIQDIEKKIDSDMKELEALSQMLKNQK